MPITRLALETALYEQTSLLIAEVGLTAVATGSSAVFGMPIASAMDQVGLSVADFNSPTDAELSAFPVSSWRKLWTVALLEWYRKLYDAWTQVDDAEGPDKTSYDQLGKRIWAKITALEAQASKQFGIGRRPTIVAVGQMSAGSTWPSTPPPPVTRGAWPRDPDQEVTPSGRFNP